MKIKDKRLDLSGFLSENEHIKVTKCAPCGGQGRTRKRYSEIQVGRTARTAGDSFTTHYYGPWEKCDDCYGGYILWIVTRAKPAVRQ